MLVLSALISSVVAQKGVPPPNPLGLNTEGSTEQYSKLKTKFGFDVSTDAGQYRYTQQKNERSGVLERQNECWI